MSSPPPSLHASPTVENLPLVSINTHPPSQAYTEPSEAEVDISMIGQDLATPPRFSMFDRTIPNHHNYGQKIEMPDSTSHWPHYIQFTIDATTYNHYVYATHNDLHQVKYGWVLEAAPFKGCTLPGVDETNLQVLLGSEEQCLGVDIALNTINDKGVTADTDRLRELAIEDIVLTWREQELADEHASWRVRNVETRAQLTKARVHLRIHPYLNHSVTFLDYFNTYHTQINHWDCLVSFILIHSQRRWLLSWNTTSRSSLSQYDMISLWLSCTIVSCTSTTLLGRFTSTFE